MQASQPSEVAQQRTGPQAIQQQQQEPVVLLDTPRNSGWISMRMGRLDDQPLVAAPAASSPATQSNGLALSDPSTNAR